MTKSGKLNISQTETMVQKECYINGEIIHPFAFISQK
jgi:hypothetical protein